VSEQREEPAVLIERRTGGGTGLFLLGLAVGAGLALLFAPQSGEETRDAVRRSARRLRRRAKDLAEDAGETFDELRQTGLDAVHDISDKGREAAREMGQTGKAAAREARRAIERRLAQHKKTNKDDSFDGEDDGV
jgi:gas vesicle protein